MEVAMTDDLPLFQLAQRDLVLTRHRRRELVRWLEGELWHRSRWLGDDAAAQSANTARRVLEERGLGDLAGAWLGAVFHPSRWEVVGRTWTQTEKGHARKINEYRPRAGVVIERVEMPQWPCSPSAGCATPGP